MNWQEIGVDAVVAMPFVLIAAAIGYWLGRRTEVQRRVDAVLRRETRPRHPSGLAFSKDTTGGTRQAYADGRCCAVGCEYYRQHLGVRLPGIAAHEAAENLADGLESLRRHRDVPGAVRRGSDVDRGQE